MNVGAIRQEILDKINTLDDSSGVAINQPVSNIVIFRAFNSQAKQYAAKTKGITDVYSFPIQTKTPFIAAPPLALRSEAYYYAYVVSRGTIFPMDMRSPRDVFPIFRYNPVNGIMNWLMPWGMGKQQYFSAFPMQNTAAIQTQLASNILSTDTTIVVDSTNGMIANHGRITIDNEKIMYAYKDNTTFYGCQRGIEGTVADNHVANATVFENNVILFYSRLPVPIIVTDPTFIDPTVLQREYEVVEEHLLGIIKATAYEILVKMDPERAEIYKVDADILYEQYRKEIQKGYYRGRQGANVREPSFNESGTPYATNLMM